MVEISPRQVRHRSQHSSLVYSKERESKKPSKGRAQDGIAVTRTSRENERVDKGSEDMFDEEHLVLPLNIESFCF